MQLKSDKNLSVTANISSGNIWLAKVKSDTPINESDRNEIRTSYNFMISYAKRDFAYSPYFREDFTVNNAPDTQGGIGVRYYCK